MSELKIREYESWHDENINNECCVCYYDTKDFVLDFGNYKTTVCKGCLDQLIKKIEECKKINFCRDCKYRNTENYQYSGFKCSCEKSARFTHCLDYYERGCDHFEEKGDK